MERKSESDVRRPQHSKNDVKWPPSWWIMHLFTMRYISSPEIPCLCINCRFLFAVILKFWCKSLYVCEIVLSCCSLNCEFISGVLHLYSPLLMISDFDGIIVHGFVSLLYIYLSWWALSFVEFLFPVAVFSFLPREVPLVFVVRLV